MKEHERQSPVSQPTAERTADQSTQSASGLSAERPGVAPERQNEDDQDKVEPRDDLSAEARTAKADSSLNTKT